MGTPTGSARIAGATSAVLPEPPAPMMPPTSSRPASQRSNATAIAPTAAPRSSRPSTAPTPSGWAAATSAAATSTLPPSPCVPRSTVRTRRPAARSRSAEIVQLRALGVEGAADIGGEGPFRPPSLLPPDERSGTSTAARRAERRLRSEPGGIYGWANGGRRQYCTKRQRRSADPARAWRLRLAGDWTLAAPLPDAAQPTRRGRAAGPSRPGDARPSGLGRWDSVLPAFLYEHCRRCARQGCGAGGRHARRRACAGCSRSRWPCPRAPRPRERRATEPARAARACGHASLVAAWSTR